MNYIKSGDGWCVEKEVFLSFEAVTKFLCDLQKSDFISVATEIDME